MKIKRIVLSSLLATGCALSLALTAFAASETSITKDQVTLNGYVSGVDWPLIMQDKIYYTGSISGANVSLVAAPTMEGGDSNKVYVQPRSNKKTLDKEYLWGDRRMVLENNGVSCGSNISMVYLDMWCLNKQDTISSTLN